MKYMGSKNRIAKHIIPIMLSERRENQTWVEPFVGGANVIEKIDGKRIGADINPYLISALISIRDYVQYLPKNNTEFTEEDYRSLRKDDSYPYKGYAGFAFSFGGKWMGGWRRDSSNKRDYITESYLNAVKQSPKLQNVSLIISSYDKLKIPPNSLIYCDPPYENTTNYKDKFNHMAFWNWCREMYNIGHTIFVSEYSAPDDFECVWEGKVVSNLKTDANSKHAIEKLFKYSGR